jgi:uridine phosphorylase
LYERHRRTRKSRQVVRMMVQRKMEEEEMKMGMEMEKKMMMLMIRFYSTPMTIMITVLNDKKYNNIKMRMMMIE